MLYPEQRVIRDIKTEHLSFVSEQERLLPLFDRHINVQANRLASSRTRRAEEVKLANRFRTLIFHHGIDCFHMHSHQASTSMPERIKCPRFDE